VLDEVLVEALGDEGGDGFGHHRRPTARLQGSRLGVHAELEVEKAAALQGDAATTGPLS
jgi:hypothetical protein